MTKIEKEIPFFRKFMYLNFGVFSIVLGGLMVWVSPESFNRVIGFLYCLSGVLYLFEYYRKRNYQSEFLAWDDEKVVVGEFLKEKKIYSSEEITHFVILKKEFLIKARGRKRHKIKLKGFSEEELTQLRARFQIVTR